MNFSVLAKVVHKTVFHFKAHHADKTQPNQHGSQHQYPPAMMLGQPSQTQRKMKRPGGSYLSS